MAAKIQNTMKKHRLFCKDVTYASITPCFSQKMSEKYVFLCFEKLALDRYAITWTE